MAVINALPQKTKSEQSASTGWNLKEIFENDKDVANYPPIYYDFAPRIFLLSDYEDTTLFSEAKMGPVKTSDGAFYDVGYSSVNHTWDKTKDEPFYLGGKEVCKIRWVICYRASKPNHIYEVMPFISYYEPEETMLLCTSQNYIYQYCYGLLTLPEKLSFINNGTANSMFQECYALKSTNLDIDLRKATGLSSTFSNCYNIEKINLKAGAVTTFTSFASQCRGLREVNLQYEQASSCQYSSMFYNCRSLVSVNGLDLLNATGSGLFNDCKKMQNLGIKNIRMNLQIGSGTSWGHNLTVDSLLNAIKETWDNTGNSTTLTLTIGSANLSKLSNVYVKLIDITDEMRAEDPYIDNKKPFEVCESTDDGAMLITEYVISKGWQIA